MKQILPAVLLVLTAISISEGNSAFACTGDCNGDAEVSINELITGVGIALGNSAVEVCSIFDRDGNGEVTVNELIAAVGNALGGCPTATPTVTLTSTVRPTATPTNRPPIIPPPGIYRTFPGFEVEMSSGAFDPDGDLLQFIAESLPPGMTLSTESGVVHWTPGAEQVGPFYAPFTVTDDAMPPGSAIGTLFFQVSPLDNCTIANCDPPTGCTAKLKPLAENCCGVADTALYCPAGPSTPRVSEVNVPCPQGRALFIGRNFLSFGRMENCDCLRAALGLQTGPEVRFNIETRCLNPIQLGVEARLETSTRVLFDLFQPLDLVFRGDGYAEVTGVRYPVDLAVPLDAIDGKEAELTVTVTDLDGVEVSRTVRVVLSFDRLPELPDP